METTTAETGKGTTAASQEWLHALTERTCRDFAGRVTQQHVLDVVREVAARYRDARVSSYLPIMVSRYTRARLLQELAKDDVK